LEQLLREQRSRFTQEAADASSTRPTVAVRRHLAPALLAALLSVGACGSTETTIDAETTIGPEATIDAEATIDPVDPTDAATSEIDLSAILLQVDDLPEGWSETPVGDNEGGSCLDELFVWATDPVGSTNASFAASELGPFLAAWVIDSPTSEALVAVDDVLVSCNGATAPSGFTTTIDPTPVSGLPSDSLSIHGVDEDASGNQIRFAVAGAGTDQVTAFVFAATPLGEIDDDVVALALNTMVSRIPAP
jgi:hypothetical protein